MNEKSETAVKPEGGSDPRQSARADETPGLSSTSETSSERPSLFERLAGYFKQRNGSSLREEIVDALAETEADGASFSPGERAMLHNILRLREVRVEDVMVPRADIEAIEIGTSLSELLVLFEQSGHSRMPVYAETLGRSPRHGAYPRCGRPCHAHREGKERAGQEGLPGGAQPCLGGSLQIGRANSI